MNAKYFSIYLCILPLICISIFCTFYCNNSYTTKLTHFTTHLSLLLVSENYSLCALYHIINGIVSSSCHFHSIFKFIHIVPSINTLIIISLSWQRLFKHKSYWFWCILCILYLVACALYMSNPRTWRYTTVLKVWYFSS